MPRTIAAWLQPGGHLIAAMGAATTPGPIEEGRLARRADVCQPARRRHLRAFIEAAGLIIRLAEEETADEDGRTTTLLWVVAEKPPPG